MQKLYLKNQSKVVLQLRQRKKIRRENPSTGLMDLISFLLILMPPWLLAVLTTSLHGKTVKVFLTNKK
jgi:hypothetical protein